MARRGALQGLLLCALFLVGCASPPRATQDPLQPQAHWQGRLSLKVYSKPVQSLSANFDLQGTPGKGELALTSPLGTTLARMQWDAGSASLTAAGQQRDYGSLQELARKVTGTDLPVASLFTWLQGRDDAAPGWQVDLKNLPDGRLQAQHVEEPQADLKIILDR